MSDRKPTTLVFPLLLVLYEISLYLSNDMYLPALPQMMIDLQMTTKQIQLTLTAWFLGSASLPLIAGVISDRFGRRPILLWGGALYIIATGACALTTNGSLLLWARFFEGCAIPTMLVAGYACIHELYETKEAIKLLALMGGITIIAPALGPLLGSLLLRYGNWRDIFYFIILWAAIALVLLIKYMPETYPKIKRIPINLRGILQQYQRIMTNKQFLLLISVFGLMFAGFIVWITAGPLLIIQTFNYTPITFGLIQVGIFTAVIVGNRLVKYLLDLLGINKLIKLGLSITLSGGWFLIGTVLLLPHNLILFLSGMIIYSFGSALCFAPLNRSIIETSTEAMGITVALFTVLWTLYIVLGSLTASYFYNGTIASIAIPIGMAITLACLLYSIPRGKAVITSSKDVF